MEVLELEFYQLCELCMRTQDESAPFTDWEVRQIRQTYMKQLRRLFNYAYEQGKDDVAKACIDRAVRYDMPESFVTVLRNDFNN
jgi:hypothetical protein